jgi:hypothetical protein
MTMKDDVSPSFLKYGAKQNVDVFETNGDFSKYIEGVPNGLVGQILFP